MHQQIIHFVLELLQWLLVLYILKTIDTLISALKVIMEYVNRKQKEEYEQLKKKEKTK